MRTLIIGYDPSGLYGYSQITRNIIEKVNLKNTNLFLYYDGAENKTVKKNNITIISRINEVASLGVRDYIKIHFLRGFFAFILQKISYKYFPSPDKGNKYNKKHLIELNKEYKFDQLIVFNDCNFWYFRIALRLKIPEKKLFIIEPPFKYSKHNHIFIRNNKKSLDFNIIKRLSNSSYQIYMPQSWYKQFGYLIKNHTIKILEFPFLVKYTPSDVYNKKLIYTGRFYYDIRNPQKLFNLMSMLSDYELHIYGEDLSDDSRYVIPNNIFFHREKHMEELFNVIKDCSALVNIENDQGTLHVSSKIITYFGFQKPILSFGHRDELVEEYAKYISFFDALTSGSLVDITLIREWLKNVKNANIDINTYPFKKYTIQFFMEEITK